MKHKGLNTKKKKRLELRQQPWFTPTLVGVITITGLVGYRNRDEWFKKSDNPYRMNYTTMSKLERAITKGKGPNGESTFLITFGSRSCGTCEVYYKTMSRYNENLNKGLSEGYVLNYVTDADLDPEVAFEIALKYIKDKKVRQWSPENGENIVDKVGIPTTFFILNGKLKDIIVGATGDEQQVIDYIKKATN